jgi:peptidoglycan/xylan/chitin deacetylase (PgdA/CDA1 family)
MISARWAPIARAAIFEACSLARLDRLLLRLAARRRQTLVLCLHSITNQLNPFWPPTPPRVLDEMLRFLKKRANVRGLRQEPIHDPRRPDVVLSFDDGYHDFVEHAMPILEKHDVRANMNVVPACIESGRPPYNVVLLDALSAAPSSLLRELRLPGVDAPAGDDREAKARFAAQLGLRLNHTPRAAQKELREALDAWIARVDFRATRMMTRDDVREAAQRHDIGAHAWQHDPMGFEADEYLRSDVARCREYFRDRLELPLDIYAFPDGSYRPSQIALLREEGIRYVLLVGERAASEPATEYPRINVASATPREARLRAAGFRARA